MTRESLFLTAIYVAALVALVAFGLLEAFAVVGAALTAWLVVIEVNSRVDAYFHAKYAQREEPRKRASGL